MLPHTVKEQIRVNTTVRQRSENVQAQPVITTSDLACPAVEVANLAVAYQGKVVFQRSSVAIEQEQITGIIGPNGAGKSTFLKGIMGLIPVQSGDVHVLGQRVRSIRQKIAYVPQRSDIDWDFPVLVRDVVMMGRYPMIGWFKRPKKKDREIVEQCLDQVGLLDYANRQIGQLSGGQQQRVFLARALAQEAQLFLLDEPFVGIDTATEKLMIEKLKELKEEGKTIIVVHHDLSKANEYFDRLLFINQRIVGYGETKEMFQPRMLHQVYNGQLAVIPSQENVMVINT